MRACHDRFVGRIGVHLIVRRRYGEARRPDGIFLAPFEQGEIGPDLFRAACKTGGWRASCRSGAIGLIAPAGHRIGSRSRTEVIRRWSEWRTRSHDHGR
jgi:hypothetical protein